MKNANSSEWALLGAMVYCDCLHKEIEAIKLIFNSIGIDTRGEKVSLHDILNVAKKSGCF